MNLGSVIKKLRLERNLSQEQLAERSGVAQTALSQIENGSRKPSEKTFSNICKALDIPEAIVYVFALEESDVPEEKRQLFKEIFPSLKDLITKVQASE